jgi:hypothetical protein
VNFLRKIFPSVCLIISTLLLFYIFYKSEIHFNGKKSGYYLPYYFITLFLIIFSIITFFINKNIKTYLIIIIATIIFTLCLFEGYLINRDYFKDNKLIKNVFYEKQLKKKAEIYKKKTGKKYDKRTRIEIYKDLKKKGNNVVVKSARSTFYDKKIRLFPLAGISNSKTIDCNENGYFSIFQSDRFGFNNPDEEWDQQEIEYLLVGDSFTQGSCVNRPNDLGSVLRTFSNKSVLNLGYAGNSLLVEYATLREYLRPNVKNVLWLYYEGNDIGGLSAEFKSSILTNYLKDLNFTQNLKFKQNKINEMTSKMILDEKEIQSNLSLNIINVLKFYQIRDLISDFIHKDEYHLKPKPQSQFKKIIKMTNDLVTKNGSKLYFIYLPEHSRYVLNYDNLNYLLVKNIVSELNIPFIDIHKEVFEKEKNPLKLFPFEMNGHFNEEGYRIVGKKIFNLSK